MLKNLLKFTILCVLSCTFLAVLNFKINNAHQYKTDKIFFTNFDNVLSIQDLPDSPRHGTGVIVQAKSGKQVVLTNRHVCEALGAVVYLNNPVTQNYASVLFKDELADLCLIELPKVLSVNIIVLAEEAPFLNEEVYSIGYPLGHLKNLIEGRVISPQTIDVQDLFYGQLDCKAVQWFDGIEYCLRSESLVSTNVLLFPGGSGSPVFNANNELVGLMSASANITNFGNMVYLADIKRVLEKF